MGYQGTLRESVHRLEATRSRGIQENIPILTLSEKERLIKKFHPDYRIGVKREIAVGVNKGTPMPNELCDLLEGKSLLDPDEIDLTNIRKKVDVLVIGGGGATAALFANEHGAYVLLATKLRFADSNTIMAEGGINACVSPGDSPMRYYIDTMGGGAFTNIPELVRALALDSPRILKCLEDLGVPFDKEPDGSVKTFRYRVPYFMTTNYRKYFG